MSVLPMPRHERALRTEWARTLVPATHRETLASLCPPGADPIEWVLSWVHEVFRVEDAIAWARAGVTSAIRARECDMAGLTPADMARECPCRDSSVAECATCNDMDAHDLAKVVRG